VTLGAITFPEFCFCEPKTRFPLVVFPSEYSLLGFKRKVFITNVFG
jgi:hypothetical protein